jgi:hypothetical protein
MSATLVSPGPFFALRRADREKGGTVHKTVREGREAGERLAAAAPSDVGLLGFWEDSAHFGIAIPLADFEGLALRHSQKDINTGEVEAEGRRLVEGGFAPEATEAFVQSVCKWGGYSGIAARVLRLNPPDLIRSRLRDALALIRGAEPDLAGALRAVNGVVALGTPSFASKHLRFLEPRLCPVFDSYLRECLPYPFDPEGYAAFAADCAALAKELGRRGASNPWPGRRDSWYVADVEASIYQWARERRGG